MDALCFATRASILFLSLLPMQASSTSLFSQFSRASDDSSFSEHSRIIGGERAEDDRYPYSVSLQRAWRGHFCGGSLIGRDTVLTAAHCFSDGGPTSIVIGSDIRNLGQRISVRKIIQHPNYNENTDEYDLGLVILDESTTLNISPIGLNEDDSFPEPGDSVRTMGWGDTDPGDGQTLSDDLLVTDVEVISNQDCKDMKKSGEKYGGWIYDDMVCAYAKGQDACQGDSGGPLIIRGANAQSDVLVGVVSWGSGCAFLPGVYSRVSKGYGWIRETTCDESDDPAVSFLCPTNRPTTRTPTHKPTRSPTEQPTRQPTHRPTTSPTNSPSLSPTEKPTLRPTLSPTTATPTQHPTERPSSMPSLSSAPTGSPSASPTSSSRPSSTPTDSPSISASPTATPSATPTASAMPSVQPSDLPSGYPSGWPSARPSLTASQSPSASSSPSVLPSVLPSLGPSDYPTMTMFPSVSINPTSSSAPSSEPTSSSTGCHGLPISAWLGIGNIILLWLL